MPRGTETPSRGHCEHARDPKSMQWREMRPLPKHKMQWVRLLARSDDRAHPVVLPHPKASGSRPPHAAPLRAPRPLREGRETAQGNRDADIHLACASAGPALPPAAPASPHHAHIPQPVPSITDPSGVRNSFGASSVIGCFAASASSTSMPQPGFSLTHA